MRKLMCHTAVSATSIGRGNQCVYKLYDDNVRKCTFGQFLILEKQCYFECITLLESASLYLTRIFQLFCEL